jgi:hypothetical protein
VVRTPPTCPEGARLHETFEDAWRKQRRQFALAEEVPLELEGQAKGPAEGEIRGCHLEVDVALDTVVEGGRVLRFVECPTGVVAPQVSEG